MKKNLILFACLIGAASMGAIGGIVMTMNTMMSKVDFHVKSCIREFADLSDKAYEDGDVSSVKLLGDHLIGVLEENLSEGWYSEWMKEREMRFMLCLQYARIGHIHQENDNEETAVEYFQNAIHHAQIVFDREMPKEELIEILKGREML